MPSLVAEKNLSLAVLRQAEEDLSAPCRLRVQDNPRLVQEAWRRACAAYAFLSLELWEEQSLWRQLLASALEAERDQILSHSETQFQKAKRAYELIQKESFHADDPKA